ncbi:MAG: ferrous iron transport protein A [Clostridiaceae bacterium]|jgi:ferrous iron transport protein A|nr:ferrous iron transport protein A [Clostridiaceae bacterium]
MFLSTGSAGENYEVLRLLGRDKVQKQLMNLGVVPGSKITVQQCMGRNMIVYIKDVRLGICRELAQHIVVKPIPSQKIPHPVCKEVRNYANCS